MTTRADHRRRLRALPGAAWPAYLAAHSGLPGPRADLTLLQAAADEGDAAVFDMLLGMQDGYLVSCGAVGLGRLLAEDPAAPGEPRLRRLAADPRWRVREAVAMALQRLGDADLPRLQQLADAWAGAGDQPLVQRAAAAGVCEPRLLREPASAEYAVELCSRLTASLSDRPASERRSADVRVLRQALGYCWSVAVAADPAGGLPPFAALERDEDPDVRWIVRENRKKRRLSSLL